MNNETKLKLPTLRKVTEQQKSRPKILLLSDDLFTTSGIGTMSKAFVVNTADQFNWVQLAAAVKHPKEGMVVDASADIAKESGVEDAYVKLYPHSGYGTQAKLRELIKLEQPDAILHFTDPRFWGWLYEMEHELRNKYKIPLCYYAIWDNFPYPVWNKSAYASCDLIMGISKQSHLIHNKVLEYAGVKTFDLNQKGLKGFKPCDVLTSYVPHGIDPNTYFPITEDHDDWENYDKFKTEFIKNNGELKFIIYWTNRNIRRKNPSDVIYGFKLFVDTLPEEGRSQVALLMHTNPVDANGTDLLAVHQAICPDYKVIFSTNKVDVTQMNYLYNLADVTVNIASNEGFGLSSAESIMAGTPVINNVTGGLQDQMRFVDDNGKWFTPSNEISSNHMARYQKCGEWAFPVFPSNRSIQGSVQTPFIFDDRVLPEDLAETLREVISVKHGSRLELPRRGMVGREWLLSDECGMSAKNMGNGIAKGLNTIIKLFKGGNRYTLKRIEPSPKLLENGITDASCQFLSD